MASADAINQFDIPRLATFLSVSQESLSQLAAAAGDYVSVILASITIKAKEHDELRADKMRAEVELEQSVKTAGSKVKSVKGQLDTALKENQQLREKFTLAENARTSLETELSTIKSTRLNEDNEGRALRSRIQSLESDKRETMEALQRKNTDYDRLQQEYQIVHSKVIELRTEAGRLEAKYQQAHSSEVSIKFREQNLQQEIELLKKNNEWFESELKTKTAEFQKFRREKATQTSTLQRDYEDALSTADMAKRSVENMKQRHEEVSKKLEDALQKIKGLQEKSITQEEAFRTEMSAQKRLTQLYEQNAKQHRDRVAQVEKILEEEREKESIEIGEARAEVETERAEKEAAEARVVELEVQVERLEADLSTYMNGHILPPGTSMRSTNGASTPQRPGSSAGMGIFSPAAMRLQKTGISITQLYSDYTSVKAGLEAERRRNEKLQGHFDELIQELELKAPEMQEQRAEHERMQGEIVQMSHMLEEMSRERDNFKKAVQKSEMRVACYERESESHKQQLRDLSLQVQFLLSEVEYLSSGNEPFSTGDRIRFQRYAAGEMNHDPSVDETPTDRIITERLLRFKNIKELQAQNENLLKITRDLAAQMEEDEKKKDKELAGRQNQELEDLRKVLDRYRDELKAMNIKAQSYIRERDMFRRMLQSRGDIAKIDNGPREESTVPSTAPSDAGTISHNQSVQEYMNLVKELQSHFDQYKLEAATDHQTLKEQCQKLAQEKSELQLHVAKVNSQLELAGQRFDMLNDNFRMSQSENQELQKRIGSMHEIQAKQDLRSQQVSEELVDARSMVESMRNENANLKAEKDLWKKIEQRLAEDNESLSMERGRLNSHISSLQALQAERERAEEENRRRLQNQVEKLEQELITTRRKLNEEVDEARRAVSKKEFDTREAQRRIDELTQTLSKAREEFVEARTQRDSLQTRINELQVELKAAEEKLVVLQPKPHGQDATMESDENEDEEGLSKEQELQMEVADLTKELERTKQELQNAKEEIKQYKSIAQTAEDELESMNSTHDQYKESMESELRDREAQIKDLEQRIEDISSELTDMTNELEKSRRADLDTKRRFADEKAILEADIARLRDEAEKVTSAASFYQDDLRAQARIAQEAQQNYERELVKHAEAAQQLQKVRSEFAELKTKVHGLRSEAEAATERLAASEESWAAQKENYEKELGEVRVRCDDLKKQNKSLLEQLDNVGSQISAFQKSRAAGEDNLETQEGDDMTSDSPLEKLRRTFTWLRREKEIVEVQYELNLQETKRLRQQLDYSQNSLDETRLLLAQERERNATRLQSEEQHKGLMEKINELNLLRESNMALRSDAERKGKRIQELQAKMEELTARIQPLEEQMGQAEAELEVKKAQIGLLEEDNNRWKSRTQQILQKYDRVDPEALEALKSEVKNLQEQLGTVTAERDRLVVELQDRQAAHAKELESVIQLWKAKLDKLVIDTKERLRLYRAQVSEKAAELQAMTTERDTLRQQTESQANVNNNASSMVQQITEEKTKLEEEKTALAVEKNQLGEKLQQLEQDLSNTRRAAQEYFRDLGLVKRRAEELESQNQELVAAASTKTEAPEVQVTQSTTSKAPQEAAQSSDDIEAIVNDRLQQYIAQEKANVEKRLQDARAGYSDYSHKKIIAEKEKFQKQLSEKMQEQQVAIDSLLQKQGAEIEEARNQVRQEYEAKMTELEARIKELEEQLQAERDKAATAATTPTGAPGTSEPPTQSLPPAEELKKIVKKNVEHRVAIEREKWKKDAELTREEQVQARLAEEIEKTLKQREEEWAKEKEEEWIAKEAELTQKNVKALESAKESAKQEAMMRSKVQVSMLEKKNKALEEKVKALEGGGVPPSPVARPNLGAGLPAPVAQQQQQEQQKRPPPQILSPQLQQTQQQQPGSRPETPTSHPQPSLSGIAPPHLQLTPSQNSDNPADTAGAPLGGIPRPSLSQPGQTPALRSLRGALTSNLPRGGLQAPAGRGVGQIPQPAQQQGQPRPLSMPPHMPGSPQQAQFQQQGNQSQQTELQHHQAMIQQQLSQIQQQQGSGRGGSQLPRGAHNMRGGFGRGRGGMQSGIPQPGQTQSGIPLPSQGQQIQQSLPSPPQGPSQGGQKLNAQARQFHPGKRHREEEEANEGEQQQQQGGHPHQGGKRVRNNGGPHA